MIRYAMLGWDGMGCPRSCLESSRSCRLRFALVIVLSKPGQVVRVLEYACPQRYLVSFVSAVLFLADETAVIHMTPRHLYRRKRRRRPPAVLLLCLLCLDMVLRVFLLHGMTLSLGAACLSLAGSATQRMQARVPSGSPRPFNRKVD